ncbi:MAG TPA: hypothetical protein VFX20_19940 [Steroidobacteraceae bacterium]|nr:hypothetical protein [Steroidobacteraceae bacterium]
MSLPKLAGVSESTIRTFLREFARLQGDQGAPRIIQSAGRAVRVQRYSGIQLELTELGFLLGPLGVVDEMRVTDICTLTARLKTDAQLAADQDALDIDAKVEAKMSGADKVRMLTLLDLSAIPRRAKAFGGRPSSNRAQVRKERKLIGTPALVMKAAQDLAAEAAVDIDDLVAEVVSKMPASGAKRGEDRRAEYATDALRKLIAGGSLHFHDGETRVGLTPEDDE